MVAHMKILRSALISVLMLSLLATSSVASGESLPAVNPAKTSPLTSSMIDSSFESWSFTGGAFGSGNVLYLGNGAGFSSSGISNETFDYTNGGTVTFTNYIEGVADSNNFSFPANLDGTLQESFMLFLDIWGNSGSGAPGNCPGQGTPNLWYTSKVVVRDASSCIVSDSGPLPNNQIHGAVQVTVHFSAISAPSPQVSISLSTGYSISLPMGQDLLTHPIRYLRFGAGSGGYGANHQISNLSIAENTDVVAPAAPELNDPVASAPQEITWSWSPGFDGGSPITSYTWSGACSGSGDVTTITCSNLTGGSKYTLAVSATNAVGTSGTASASLMATSVPAAPTVSSPTRPASGQLTWNWSPNSDGGSPITSYTWSGACSGSGDVTTATCSNLTGGSNYTLTVSATNAIGASDTSSSSLTALTVPGLATELAAQSGLDRAIALSWKAPSRTGGTPILSYTATASPGGRSCSSTGTSCSVTGLTNGQSYTFTVVATNAMGDGAASQMSSSATPWSAPVAFGQPSIVPANGQLIASWTPPSDTGGFPITGYTATASPGGKSCSTSGLTCTIAGLDQSTSYSVQVVATNSKGLSSLSAPSLQVYAVGATSLKVKTIPFVVQTKTPFLVLAYGAHAGKLVTIAIPGSQGSCTTNVVGQCTASLSVKNPGSYTALAIFGSKSASSSFYAPSITIPLGVKHGKSFTIAIKNAPAKSQVLITLSDGRTKLATTSGAGAASISIPAPKIGLLVVTPSFGGVKLKPSTVLVS